MPVAERAIQRRFQWLLALLVAVFVLSPFFEPRGFAAMATRLAIEVALLGAVWTLRHGLAIPLLASGAIAAHEALYWLTTGSPSPGLVLTREALGLVFLAAVAGFLTWLFWTGRRIGAGSVAAAISTFLLLGVFWANAFALLEFVTPGSFGGVCEPLPDGQVDCIRAQGHFPRLSYLAFVTLTTLGFGDMTPLTRAAEGLATMAAVSGQLFVAILIGRIVGIVSRERRD